MSCPIPKCTAAVRWHNTLCQQHARQVPQALQYLVARDAANLLRSRRPALVQAWSKRYRKALADAVASVSAGEPA